ncbi:MAG: protein-disulfide reductase DsbD domain-containing protein [Candidatus Competibacterales bacterium]
MALPLAWGVVHGQSSLLESTGDPWSAEGSFNPLPGDGNEASLAEKALGDLAADPEVLDPTEAFRLSLMEEEAGILTLHWDIADGYYLYRHRLKFTATRDEFQLGQPQLPPGDIIVDEFFGRVETYRHSLTVHLPVAVHPEGEGPQTGAFELEVRSQGCADVGVCYLPRTERLPVALASSPRPSPRRGAVAEPASP